MLNKEYLNYLVAMHSRVAAPVGPPTPFPIPFPALAEQDCHPCLPILMWTSLLPPHSRKDIPPASHIRTVLPPPQLPAPPPIRTALNYFNNPLKHSKTNIQKRFKKTSFQK